MKKEEIIELLKTYKEKQAKLDLKKTEKKKLLIKLKHTEEEINPKISQNYEEGGNKTNIVSSKVENLILKKEKQVYEISEEIKILDDEIEVLEIEVEEVKIRLGSLTYLENKIITAYYVDELSPEYIGNYTYYEVKHQTRSSRTIERIIKNILKKMEKI